jgi:hypothetical protein
LTAGFGFKLRRECRMEDEDDDEEQNVHGLGY